MDDLMNIIDKKLKSFGLVPFLQLDPKTQDRLINIETFIINNTNKKSALVQEIKSMKLTILLIANAEDAYSGVSGRRFRIYPDSKPEHPDTLSCKLIL